MTYIVIAFIVGLLVTLWLANRQQSYTPMFGARKSPWLKLGPKWWALVACVVAGGGLLAYGIAGFIDMVTPDAPTPVAAAPNSSRLLIPALQLDEDIVNVPVGSDGWDITHLGLHVGWLETTGRAPNDVKAIALIGHVTVSALEAGPFASLYTLQAFDQIVYRSGGIDYVYSVSSVNKVKPDEVDKLYQPLGDHLLLVTCTDWDIITETYQDRLLVDAVLISQTASQ